MSSKFDSLINPIVNCKQGGTDFLRPFAHSPLNFLHDCVSSKEVEVPWAGKTEAQVCFYFCMRMTMCLQSFLVILTLLFTIIFSSSLLISLKVGLLSGSCFQQRSIKLYLFHERQFISCISHSLITVFVLSNTYLSGFVCNAMLAIQWKSFR